MALAWFLQKKLYQKNWQKNLKIQPGDPRKSRRWGSAGDWVTFAQQRIGKDVLP